MNATDYHHENIIEIKERFWRSFPIVWMSAHPAKCTAAHLDWPACCVWQHERSCALESKSTNTHASLKGKHTSPVTPQPPFFPFSLIVTFPRKVPCCHTFKQCSRDVGRVSEQHDSYISTSPPSGTSTASLVLFLLLTLIQSHLQQSIHMVNLSIFFKISVFAWFIWSKHTVKIVILWNIITI